MNAKVNILDFAKSLVQQQAFKAETLAFLYDGVGHHNEAPPHSSLGTAQFLKEAAVCLNTIRDLLDDVGRDGSGYEVEVPEGLDESLPAVIKAIEQDYKTRKPKGAA